MKTRITALLGTRHPIFMSGMSYISEHGLAAAVSNAGGLGIAALTHFPPDRTKEAIRVIKSSTDKPFGVNISLIRPWARERVEIALEEKVHVINYALGKPWFIEACHAYGGIVIGTVATVKHAIAAEKMGVDAIIVTGYEAAAHGSDLGSMVLIPLIASCVKIPVVAAGGFCDGKGLAAALVLGAEGIAMGTRFTVTKESIVHQRVKQLICEANEESTVRSDRFDGIPCRVLRTKSAEGMLRRRLPFSMSSISESLKLRKELKLSMRQLFSAALGMRKFEQLPLTKLGIVSTFFYRMEKTVRDGDVDFGLMPVSQNCARMDDVPTCAEVIEQVVAEATEILERTRTRIVS